MIHCSLPEALAIWSELDEALAGTNGYGGNVAEIYAYRIVGHIPRLALEGKGPISADMRKDALKKIKDTFKELLSYFCQLREAKILVDGVSLSRWKPVSLHRYHVQVVPKGRQG